MLIKIKPLTKYVIIIRPGQGGGGGVGVGYQYTRYFAPKIPIYHKLVKCVILNT